MKSTQQINKNTYQLKNGVICRQLQTDVVVVEQPLQIHLKFNALPNAPDASAGGIENPITLTLTMRTPGEDKALAVGLLKAEGLIDSISDIVEIETHPEANGITLTLKHKAQGFEKKIERHFMSNSSCGICGKTSIKALELNHPPQLPAVTKQLELAILLSLPKRLKQRQKLFQKTGGIHAAGIFSLAGECLHLSEDVGRHNALDKVIGEALLLQQSSEDKLIVLSGRASFELLQKAVMAGYAVVLSVGAPSSLAISVAQRFDITLMGFITDNSCNVYSGDWRIQRE